MNTWDIIKKKAEAYDSLIITAKGYGYDSLCLRYQIARDAQMEFELLKDAKLTGGNREEQIKSRAERYKMRFFQILGDLIGEHD